MWPFLALWICGPGAQVASADDAAAQRALVNGGTVGLISGGVTGTYVRIAADLANALDDGYELRVLPIIGKGSVRNIEDLVLLRGVDVAIVQSDVLDFYKRADLVSNIEGKVRYISKLYNEEVHLLAKSEFGTVDDLNGRRVNFGTEGSGTFMTASIIFDDLGIDVDVSSYPEPIALEKLLAGELDALVFVGGKPVEFVQNVSRQDQLHLLDIPPGRIKAAYLPSELTADAYPSLIDAGDSRADRCGERRVGGLQLARRPSPPAEAGSVHREVLRELRKPARAAVPSEVARDRPYGAGARMAADHACQPVGGGGQVTAAWPAPRLRPRSSGADGMRNRAKIAISLQEAGGGSCGHGRWRSWCRPGQARRAQLGPIPSS